MTLDKMSKIVTLLAFTALIGTASFTALAKEPSLTALEETPEFKNALSIIHHHKGLSAYDKGDYTTAYQKIKSAAELGNADAQKDLAVLYRYGNGTPQNYQKAVKWFQEAADKAIRNLSTDWDAYTA